jgi:iron complex outermembrane receptor protein
VSSYAKVGLTGSYAWKLDNAKLTFQLNVDNLLDTRYYSEGTVGPLGVYVGQPRTFKGLRPHGILTMRRSFQVKGRL